MQLLLTGILLLSTAV